MKGKNIIPRVPFYFVRHGQTDWNKNKQTLCNQDDITINETGTLQAKHASKKTSSLGITKIYSSPLKRAVQTAQIINKPLALSIEFHQGLREIKDAQVAYALHEILDEAHTMLIVSHGEVYRVLLRILNIQTVTFNAKNCGIYLFKPLNNSDAWEVEIVDESYEIA